MIQIGVKPLSAASTQGRPPDPARPVDGHPGQENRLPGDPSEQDGFLFVSPPPLPFPRVFPGL